MKLDNDPAGEELSGEVEEVRVVEQDQELGEPSLLHHHGGGGGPACGPGEIAGELTLHVTPTARQSHPHQYIIYVEQYDFHQGSQIFLTLSQPHYWPARLTKSSLNNPVTKYLV